MQHISVTELKTYLDRVEQPPLLLDVREPWEFRICHIDGSLLVPMGSVPSYLQELDAAREIVVICHHGIRSRQVALYLEQQGFARVINMEGGVAAWARDVDPGMPAY